MNPVTISHIFASALQERRTLGNFTVYWLLAAMTVGLPLIPFGLGYANAANLALMILCGMLYAILLSILPQFIVSTLRLATPHFNRTVPGLTGSLKTAYGIMIFGSSALLALLPCLQFHSFEIAVQDFFLGFSLIAMSLLCASFFCLPGNLKYSLAVGTILGLVLLTLGHTIRLALVSLQSMNALVVLGLLIDAVLFVFLAHWIFAVKGERAYRVAEKLRGFNAMMKGEMSKSSVIDWGKRMGTQWLYDYACQHAIQNNNKPRALLMGLGYGMHWSVIASNLFWGAVILVLIPVGANLLGYHKLSDDNILFSTLLFIGFATPLSVIHRAFQTLQQSRAEQQLLKLLPSGVQGRGYNRWLALGLMRQFGLSVLAAISLSALTWLCIGALALDTAQIDLKLLPAMLVAILPMSLATLNNYAALKNSYAKTWQFYIATSFVLLLLYIAIDSRKTSPNLFWIESIVVILVTLLLFLRRWKQTLAAPVALPIGRLVQ